MRHRRRVTLTSAGYIVLLIGCLDPGTKPDREKKVPHPAHSHPPTEQSQRSTVEQLREVGLRVGVLDPASLAEILGTNIDKPGRPPFWSLMVSSSVRVTAEAPSKTKPAMWVKFSLSRDVGLRLRDLEDLYGTDYRAILGQKDGADIFYTAPKPDSVAAGTHVSARLWNTTTEPDSVVVQVNLHSDLTEASE